MERQTKRTVLPLEPHFLFLQVTSPFVEVEKKARSGAGWSLNNGARALLGYKPLSYARSAGVLYLRILSNVTSRHEGVRGERKMPVEPFPLALVRHSGQGT